MNLSTNENPALGFGHDPHIYKDEVTGKYYIYSTDTGMFGEKPIPGGQIRRSVDLINWEYIGVALPGGAPDEVFEHTNSRHFWAPDMVRVGNEIRMYFSVSTFGSQNSAIILATSENPEGPFVYKGTVIKTKNSDPVNAIDANIIIDNETGEHYMTYGSFWGGIKIIALDKETGFAKESGLGKTICVRPRSVDGAVEGAYIIYNKDTGYYYLFVSYASLTNFYNVRVARSKTVDGVYTDFNGVSMIDSENNPEDVGLKITTGYQFGDREGFMALGHNSVLNDNGQWYIIHHVRIDKQLKKPFIQIRKIFWTKNGWPIVSPVTYKGNVSDDFNVIGDYDYITFENKPQDTATKSSVFTFNADGTCTNGTWEKNGNNLIIKYNGTTVHCFTEVAFDENSGKNVVAISGIMDNGICVWAVSCK